jgi:hypothetical protein
MSRNYIIITFKEKTAQDETLNKDTNLNLQEDYRTQWVSGDPSLEVKRSEREADHSPPSSADVKNAWSYACTPPIRLHGAVLS